MTAVTTGGTHLTHRPRRRQVRQAATFYAFISPWLLGTVLLTAFPLGYALYLSFTAWDGISPFKPWVGLDNYREVFTSADTFDSLERTLLLVVIVVPATVFGSLLLAMMLNEKVRGRVAFRAMIFIPSIVPTVAASLIWKVIFDKNSGAANRVLETFGGSPVSWLTGGHAFVPLCVVMLWGLGAGIIIYLAALQTVDTQQLEAATLDGAGRIATFRAVTFPAISPVVLFQTVVTLITTLQTFIPALLLSPAANNSTAQIVPESNQLYMVDVYSQYFQYSRYGYGSAMIVVFFIVILILTAVVFKTVGRHVYYANDPSDQGPS